MTEGVSPTPIPSGAPSPQGITVLVVDDEPVVRLEIVRTLQRLGHRRVRGTGPGAAALAEARRCRPDVAVIDLPAGEPEAAVRVARALQRGQGTAIVFASTATEGATMDRALEVVPDAYLPKPLDPIGLDTAVRTAARRRQADRRAHALARSAPDGLMRIGTDGTIEGLNGRLAAIFGYEEEELLGRSVELLVPPRVRDRHPAYRARFFDRSGVRPMGLGSRVVGLRRDGTEVPVDVSLQADVAGVTATVRDVTEARALEDALRAERARFGALFEQAPVGMALLDGRGRVVRANPRLEAMLGPRASAPGHALLEPGLTAPLDAAQRARVRALMEGAADVFAGQVTLDLGDRGARWVEVKLRAIHVHDDPPERSFLLLAEDVHARREAEAERRQAARMDAVREMAAGIAHELNNLLTTVVCATEMAARDGASSGALDEITHAAGRAADLTSQLLAISQRQILEPRDVDTARLLRGMRERLEALAGEDVALVLDVPRALPRLKADPGQLQLAVTNLALNALEAMPRGGRLELRARATRAALQIDVVDTGRGMPARVAERAFEPFFTTKPFGRGAGLGLATVHGIVRQSGGTIALESEEGRGTRVRLTLPVAREPSRAPSTPSPPPEAGPVDRPTVLLVEDDPMVRRVATRILRRAGYAVLTAGDGHEAQRVLARPATSPHLVLTDVQMPGCNGLELADALAGSHPELPVLFMTGYADDAAGTLRGRRVLRKPFTSGELLAHVAQPLEASA
ncbi:MAG TPA: response regulator [Sandaracinaceae bacterium LLY-WYZ-13_1]|nr:response regulator [Sandaracinaceae bacterium LLY-WYZ-13_1]